MDDCGSQTVSVCQIDLVGTEPPRSLTDRAEIVTVAIQRTRGGHVCQAVRAAIDVLGGIERYVRPGAMVLIKPNLVCARDWRTGTTTNPAVVEALIRLAWKAGAARVIIGEGSGIGENTRDVFAALGYDALARRLAANLADLNQDPVRVLHQDALVLKEMAISRAALEADVLINVPVLKTHTATTVTLSLKNMKGIVPHSQKRRIHFVGLHEGIVDLNTFRPPDLVVVDGTIGQENLGPITGTPVEMGLILAGANPVAVDTVCCHVMGIEPTEVTHIVKASGAGLGPISLQDIELRGANLASVQRRFQLPTLDAGAIIPHKGIRLVEGTACSGCAAQIALAVRELEESGELALLIKKVGTVTLVYGAGAPSYESQSKGIRLFVGKCQKRSKGSTLWVPGCPALGSLIKDTLRSAAGLADRDPFWFEAADG